MDDEKEKKAIIMKMQLQPWKRILDVFEEKNIFFSLFIVLLF